MNSPSEHTERLHALDATRAFALILGVIFHAVWFYAPYTMNQAVFDVRSNHFFGWFFFASHSFRMQLFFVIAGFFGRLLIERRGVRGFVSNRWKRIGIPLLVGWLFLFPLFYIVWIWGYRASGQMDFPAPLYVVPLWLFLGGAAFEHRANGGAFNLTHLWFLYQLLVFYSLALGIRSFARMESGDESPLWSRIDRCVRWVTRGFLGLLAFSILCAPGMYFMRAWNGVDTPAMSLIPDAFPTLVYFLFFALGWALHRQMRELATRFRQWRWFLALALIGSVPLYWVFLEVDTHETALAQGTLEGREVVDWEAFGASLNAGLAQSDDSRDTLGRLTLNLSPLNRESLAGEDPLSRSERSGLLMAINRALTQAALTAEEYSAPELGAPVETSREAVLLNRKALDELWLGVEPTGFRRSRNYLVTKAWYSLAYSVMMVAFVFGTLGAFQELCHSHSPTWRYFADASYWIYIAHIPVVPILEILIFRWDIPSWIKVPGLLVVSFSILTLSYHYLVRSTFIGKALNGRKYPYAPNVWKVIRHGAD